MNRLTRLTALLLAMLMIFSTFAAAETAYQAGEMTLEQWNALVEKVDSIVGTPTIDKGDSGAVVRPVIPDQPTMGAVPGGNQYLVTTQADLTAGSVEDAVLYTSGKLIITSAQADQWQINVGGVWVNITGEEGQTITVTNAMVQNLGTSVQVRQAGSPDKVAYITVMEYAATMMLVAAARASEVTEEEETAPDRANDVMTVEEANQYTVIINYSYEDGTMAANPWTASLAKGSSFSATVAHPTVIGYNPTFDEIVPPEMSGVTYSVTDVSINIPSVDRNVTVYITYVPGTVNYTVIHYHQNVDNDNYTIVGSTVNTGTTGDQVPESDIAEPPAGFYALLYDRPTIAADGSTVVEIYYDRYYYLMNFDLGGGYGVEPIYARFGTPIDATTLGTPVKAGYVFKGWTTDPNATEYTAGQTFATLPTTMPAGHTTYYAVWEVEELAKVSVVIWGENANDEDYAYQKTIEIYAKPGSTVSFTTANTVCGYTAHTHDEDCYDCGVTVHTHGPDCCTIEAHTHGANCCTVVVHNHGTACYPNVGNRTTNVGSNAPRNPSEGQIYRRNNGNRYIYINGAWYTYSGNESSETILNPTCGQTETTHVHGDGSCVYCDKTEHTHDGTNCVYCTEAEHAHNEECLSCTLTEHTHTSSCYITNPNMASNLWELVKSDTVTVEADGSTVMNVYYDRKAFTLTFRANSRTVYTINEKWGADISEHWPIKGTNGTTYDDGQRWTPSGSSTFNQVLVFLEIMPAESFTLTVSEVNYDTFIMHYMVEALASETTGVTTYTYNGTTKRFTEAFKVEANYNFVTKAEDFFDVEGFTQWTSNPRFGSNNQLDINGGGDVYFYYTRNSYTLSFNDGYNVVKTETVLYGDSWAQFEDYEPALPSQYEAGSRDFAGWYWNPQGTSDEIVLSEETMPAENVIIYAKWTPKVYTVRFFLTEDLMKTGLDENVYIPQFIYNEEDGTITPGVIGAAHFPNVPHGIRIDQDYVKMCLDYDAMIAANPRDPYSFVVWCYYDETGTKQVFTPTMQIKQNLDLFAEWTSDILVPYTIKYAVPQINTDGTYVTDADGNWVIDFEVAAPTTGSKLAGQQQTFEAKGGDELYAAYQEGYFPQLDSHTISFTEEQFEAGGVEYIFWYSSATAVPYKVYYKIVDEEGNILGPAIVKDGVEYVKEVNDNKKAVVTENFEVVAGYMPDAYQKRLVVSTTGENIITFYYTKDELHAYYQVTHYVKNLDGDYVEYLPPSQIPGDIGKTVYEDDALTIDGFTHVKREYVYDNGVDEPTTTVGSPNGVHLLDAYGLQINLYYDRISYPYVVNYYKQGKTESLAPSKNGTGLYGDTVTENAIDIPGYVKVEPTTQELQIRIEKNSVPEYNILNFYYAEIPATINYVPVTSDGVTKTANSSDGGTVSHISETIGAVTGTALGSVPTAKANYTFMGWYTDEACTNSVNEAWVDQTTKKITPQKTKDYDAGDNEKMGYESATYYALFEENVTTITYTPMYETTDGTLVQGTTGGTVAPTSETVKVVTGTAQGSTADAADPTYKFDGWYSDAACTHKVGNDVFFKPTKGADEIWDESNTKYYAKFVYDVGHLSITKNVVNNTTPKFAPVHTAFTFTVTLTGEGLNDSYVVKQGDATVQSYWTKDGNKRTGTFTLTATDTAPATVVIEGILNGTAYTVTEASVTGYTTTSTGEAANIVAGQSVSAVFTNTYKVGTLNVTKTVVGEPTANYPQSFNFTLTLSDASALANCKIQIDNGDVTAMPQDGKFSLMDGQVAKITGIPQNVTYTVKENEQADGKNVADYFDVSATNATGTMTADGNVTAAFINTAKTGSLTIKKTATGGNADDTFLFDVTGPNDYKTTVVLKAGGSIILTELPFGEYNVKENTAWSWRYTTDAAEKSATISATKNGHVEISNTINNEKWLDDEAEVVNEFTATN